jgi:processive 1,2-diacylglycerol beta-glucosyltransferase
MKKRVLLMYISVSSGHHRASLAIEKALKLIEPQTEVLNINSLNYTNPLMERVINRSYMTVIKRTPEVWEYLYDNPKVVKSTQKLKETIHKLNSWKLKTLLDEFKPNAIACTQAFPCGMVADFKKTFGLGIPLFGVLTDYRPHSYWYYDEVDYYIAASAQTKEKFVANGVSKDRIKIFGIPIDPDFTKDYNREEIASRFNIDLSKPAILIMGGGQGLGPIKKIIQCFDGLDMDFQVIVLAGMNQSLFRWLNREKKRFSKKLFAFSYTDSVRELMTISTLLVTKAGGLTIAESLACGLPLIIINPIPGQEYNNSNYLLSKGIALKAEDASELAGLSKKLLTDTRRLQQMRSLAKKEGKPSAALDTARLILEVC